MKIRVVRFLLPSGEYETLATSLSRNFLMEEIKELYQKRWGIETSYRNLKHTVGLANLHGKSDDFVEQEIYAALNIYNFCSRAVNAIVLKKRAENIHMYKINFKMAVNLYRKYLKDPEMGGVELMAQLEKYVEPVRPGRMDKRNLRPKGFTGFIYRVAA